MSVLNAITLVQEKDAELKIIEGLHNHDLGHEINNIHPKHNDKTANIGPCHTCNGPHLIKYCNKSIHGRCKPNLDKHTPARCPRKCPFNKHYSSSTPHSNDNSSRTKINNYTEPNLQLSVSTNKPHHMAKLLDATRKMTKYFIKLVKHNKPQCNENSNSTTGTNHHNNAHSHKHKPCNDSDEVNNITNSIHIPKTTLTEPEYINKHYDSDSSDSILDSSLCSE